MASEEEFNLWHRFLVLCSILSIDLLFIFFTFIFTLPSCLSFGHRSFSRYLVFVFYSTWYVQFSRRSGFLQWLQILFHFIISLSFSLLTFIHAVFLFYSVLFCSVQFHFSNITTPSLCISSFSFLYQLWIGYFFLIVPYGKSNPILFLLSPFLCKVVAWETAARVLRYLGSALRIFYKIAESLVAMLLFAIYCAETLLMYQYVCVKAHENTHNIHGKRLK